MAIAFDNQLVTLDDVIQQDIEELKRKNKDVTIKEWITHTAGANTSHMPDGILLHSDQLYSVPKSVEQASQGKRAKITKRSLEKTTGTPGESTERGSQGKGEAKNSATPKENTGISTNDYYDPSILQDYGGEVFRHENASLRQLDFRNVDNELIHPRDWYSVLSRGTLIMARATLHAYNWEGRRVYQLSAQTIRVLRHSTLPMELVSKIHDDQEVDAQSSNCCACYCIHSTGKTFERVMI